MCRIAAYFGPPLSAEDFLLKPPHGLEHQSRHAREMNGESVAGDGWGVGWFPPGQSRPGLFKNILPLWSDENAKTGCPAIISGNMVGHIRLASPGIEVCLTNTPLYPLDDYLYTMNGEASPWPGPISRALRQHLGPDEEAALRGSTDAEMIGGLWRTCFRENGGQDMAAALRETIRIARDVALAHGGSLKANLIVAGPSGFAAVRFAEGAEPNSLYYLTGEKRWQGGSLVASEPLDDGPGWHRVAPSTLVCADATGLKTSRLRLSSGRLHSSA